MQNQRIVETDRQTNKQTDKQREREREREKIQRSVNKKMDKRKFLHSDTKRHIDSTAKTQTLNPQF